MEAREITYLKEHFGLGRNKEMTTQFLLVYQIGKRKNINVSRRMICIHSSNLLRHTHLTSLGQTRALISTLSDYPIISGEKS